jgi:hypothetical protein
VHVFLLRAFLLRTLHAVHVIQILLKAFQAVHVFLLGAFLLRALHAVHACPLRAFHAVHVLLLSAFHTVIVFLLGTFLHWAFLLRVFHAGACIST